MSFARLLRRLRGPAIFVLVFLVIEFVDEFVYGAREAALPLIRSDLGLSYEQIGLLLGVPALIANVIEPVIGILGDVWQRRAIILVGGIIFAIEVLALATSTSFVLILISFIIFYPASGAFVSLSQSTLMDSDPARHEQNMARWTFAGSLGVVAGSLGLGATIALGLGWRVIFVGGAMLALVLVLILSRLKFPRPQLETDDGEKLTFKAGFRNAVRALRRRDVVRWLVLLEFSNLMLDILYGYLALYFVDVVGVSEAEAVFAVSVWTVVGLVGDFLLIPLLERVRGLSYLRVSAVLELVLFSAFLLVPGMLPKLIILGALGFFNSGWYSVLSAQLYSAMPGQSGAVMAINSVSGTFGGLIPLALGLLADRFGLGFAIWWLILGPIVILIGLPRKGLPYPLTPSPNSVRGNMVDN